MFTVLFPISFLANTFAPTEPMQHWLRVIAEWNPVSSLAQAMRELWGNAGPAPESAQLPLHHPVLATIVWAFCADGDLRAVRAARLRPSHRGLTADGLARGHPVLPDDQVSDREQDCRRCRHQRQHLKEFGHYAPRPDQAPALRCGPIPSGRTPATTSSHTRPARAGLARVVRRLPSAPPQVFPACPGRPSRPGRGDPPSPSLPWCAPVCAPGPAIATATRPEPR